MSEHRVTEYKVRKALESGSPKDPDVLAASTNRPISEVRKVLVRMFPDEFGTPSVDVPYRTTATIDELVAYAQGLVTHRGLQALVDWEYYPSACGCMGPRDGDPLCPCAMRAALAKHKIAVLDRFDPALALQVMRQNLIRALAGH